MDANEGRRGTPFPGVETEANEGEGGGSPPAGVETGVNKGEGGRNDEIKVNDSGGEVLACKSR